MSECKHENVLGGESVPAYCRDCGADSRDVIATLRARVAELEARQDEAEEVFQRIRSWAEAYPKDIFPELDEGDWIDINEALATINITLDRVAASNMRHVITEVAAMLPAPPEDKSDERHNPAP